MADKIVIIGKGALAETAKNAVQQAGFDVGLFGEVDQAEAALKEAKLAWLLSGDAGQDEKKKTIAAMETSMADDAIIAVHSILYNLTLLGAQLKNKTRLVGLRLIGEAYVGEHLELTRGHLTDCETIEKARTFAETFTARVVDAPDIVGGIYYRIMPAMPNMASYMLDEGITAEDIENAMLYGINAKIGPLHLADEVGLDLLLKLLEAIYEEGRDEAYRPSPMIRKLVAAGYTGKKAGRGFFRYEEGGNA